MNICEYADSLNIEICLRYYPNQGGRWCADFDSCEIVDGCILTSAHGNAQTPEEAIEEYLEQIRGKRIIFNAMDKEKRREYEVPKSLAGMP
jgi:hypothetical protein